jgi:hypothetical protein
MKDDELFTLDEVLGGFSAKRTRLLLFQIENRTAYSMAQAQRAADPYLTEETAEHQDLAFFAALAEGRESSFRPTIRDLERYASDWQSLIPPNPTLQGGVITVPVVAGVFPILLLLASRRKGENIPAFVLPFLAHPIVAGGIYLVAVSTLFLHGLLIWQDPFQRGMALLVGSIILAITTLLMRQGAFARRMVIEVRQDPPLTEQASGTFLVSDCGRPARQNTVCLGYLDGERFYQEANGTIPHFGDLCSAKFSVPTTQAQELMVWVHRVTLEGHSENLPVLVKVTSAGQMRTFHLNATGQRLVLSLRAEGKQVSKEEPREAGPLEVEVQLAATTAEGTSPIDEAKS